MSREKSNLEENFEQQEFKRSTSAKVSNSFNPPLSERFKSPLPAIKNQAPAVILPPSNSHSISLTSDLNDENDLVLPTKVFQNPKKSVKNLSQGLCSYLWFRRIKEIFLMMGKQNDTFTRFDMDLARNDMIQTCEQYLESERPKGGGTQLAEAEQVKLDRWKNKRLYGETFRMSYFRKENDSEGKSRKFSRINQTELSHGEIPNFDNAIWWYSCNEAPIFDQMNNILRLENFELLMCHRYYISDLCQMIERSYTQNKFSQKQQVYRADKLSADDFKILKESLNQKDARIVINGFISTSRNEKISLEYAQNKLKKRGNDVVIMYEITIDPTIPCSSYADIESISFHPREEEVLFNMGSTFQIDSIDTDPSNADIQRIKLTAKDFTLNLIDEMKAKVKQSSQATLSILLVRYLIELGEERVCKRYLSQLIESKHLETDTNLVSVYNCLGIIHSRQALYGEALEYYRKALNTQARLQFSNNNALAEIFNYIGQTHLGLKQLDEAEQNLEEGIRIQKRESKYNQQHLAELYCNLGQVAYARHDLDEADKHFQLSYDLYNRNTKISHDALEKQLLKADLCLAYGHLKSLQNPKDPTEANEKFHEALEIYECILPSTHSKLAETHIDIVCEYTRNKNFQAVIDYYHGYLRPLLKDYENKYTTSQMDLANLYTNIGACFAYQDRFDDAMEIWKLALEHEQKSFLDELLSSARISKVQLPRRIIETAYRQAFEYYSNIIDANKEYLAILYTKMHAYEQVISILRGQNSYLLAHVCIILRNFKGGMVVYKRIIEAVENFDLTLLIGILIKILTIKTGTSSQDEPRKELERTEKLLRTKIGDNEALRLRMVINDYLSQTYIQLKNYEEARQCSQISFELKQRFYSSHHSSIIRNYQPMALYSYQQNDYKNAVQYYEKAIEIQQENMPTGHVDIRTNYFLLGDCYCRMDKIDLAMEYYNQAQSSNDFDNEDDNEIESDVKALLRMNTNLAEAYAKQKDYSTAIDHLQNKIDTLKEIVPKLIVEIIEDEQIDSITFDQLKKVFKTRLGLNDGNKLPQILRNLVFIRFSLAQVLLQIDQRTDDDEDPTDVYEQTIELQLKLTLFETADEHDLANRYEELSNAYEKLYSSMKETIKDNLLKALDETNDVDRQRSLEYRLGNLYFEEESYTEADQYWKSALKKVKSNQGTMKTIIENLIKKNEGNLSTSEEDDTEEDDGEDDEQEEEKEQQDEKETGENEEEEQPRNESRVQSVKSQRRLSTKSVNDKEKPEELAQAYLDLGDDTTAMKYLKKYISKLEDVLKLQWPANEFHSEQLPMIKLFYSMLTETIDSLKSSATDWKEITDQSTWNNLLQAYIKVFNIALRMTDSFDQLSKAMLAIFYTAEKIYDLPSYLTALFKRLFKEDFDNIQWNQFLDFVSPMQVTIILMTIAEYYLAQENWTDALQIYRILQENSQDDEITKSAINYALLKLLELHIIADEDYRQNIMSIDLQSTTIPIFDRTILCRLIIVYMDELEDEENSSLFEKKLLDLKMEEWKVSHLKNTLGIGHILMKFNHHLVASWYWSDLQSLCNENLPDSIVNRLYSTDSTFEQIYFAIQDLSNDLFDNSSSLASSYALMSIYEECDNSKDDAHQSLTQAMVIGKKLPLFQEKVQQWQIKLDTLVDS